jgi:hypothetical protein
MPHAGQMTERSDDGRYVVVAGRRWRAADPMIPPETPVPRPGAG